MNEEQRIAVATTGVTQIYSMLRTAPQNWRNYLNLARAVIAHLDATTFMRRTSRTTEQAWMIAGLQQFAYIDTEGGPIADVAAWCSRQWLEISQREPQNVAALRGIGQAWLHRVQPVLARINAAEGGSSSSGSGNGSGSYSGSGSGSQQSSTSRPRIEDDMVARANTERRVDAQDYVEARQYLQPATEYLQRAVVAATTQRIISGDLLSTAAEAYMSLGNVSSPRNNEQYFRRALQLLRAAVNIPNYTLSRDLQQYLDDYGRLLD